MSSIHIFPIVLQFVSLFDQDLEGSYIVTDWYGSYDATNL